MTIISIEISSPFFVLYKRYICGILYITDRAVDEYPIIRIPYSGTESVICNYDDYTDDYTDEYNIYVVFIFITSKNKDKIRVYMM